MSRMPPGPGHRPGPPTGQGPPGLFAPFGLRAGAFLIDVALLNVVAYFLLRNQDPDLRLGLAFAVELGYSLLLLSSPMGQTVGMRVVGIRLVDVHTGGRVESTRVLMRFLVAIASRLLCLLGYLAMLWSPTAQTWHDRVAATYVVRTNPH